MEEPVEKPRKVWAVKLGDKPPFDLRDMYVEDIDAVCKEADLGYGAWGVLIVQPTIDPTAGVALLRMVAEKYLGGVEVPEKVTIRYLEAAYVEIEDTMPEPDDPAPDDSVDPTTGSATQTAG